MTHALIPGLLLALLQPKGLVIADTVIGKGAAAAKEDTVTVGYKGWLQADGKVFDQTSGQPPFVFTVGKKEVIAGWDEGLVGMKAGGKRILVIPSDLAYGDKGAGPIPARSTLVFEIELLRVDKPGAKTMIEIEEITAGSGPEAKKGDKVEVHYTGTFLNGQKFDSSRDRNQTFPVTIGTTGIIKGFEQGLIGMKAGGVRRVTIPYQLAYGEQARGPIPAKSTLVFELEIVKLEPGH